MANKKKIVIITTVPFSLIFFKGQIQILKKSFDVILVSSPGEMLDKICLEESVKGYGIEMKRNISIFNDLKSLNNLIRLFKKIQPDIIHCNTLKAGFLGTLAGSITQIETIIYYLHGTRYDCLSGIKRRLVIRVIKLSCSFATDIFAVSFGVKNTLQKDHITKKNINIIANGSINGIDFDYFSRENKTIPNIREKYNLNQHDFVFGFVGRLVRDKGINELVKSFNLVSKIRNNVKLLLVGDFENKLNPLEPSVIKEIKENPKIIWAGFQNDVRPFYKVMDVFVFPSYREGFGVSLLEAQAMEVACIATNITGCNEIITHGLNGILIQPNDILALYKAMIELMIDEEKRKIYAENGRKITTKKYNQQKVWEETLKAYNNLIKVSQEQKC